MNPLTLELARRGCHIYQQNSPQCLLVQPLGRHDQDSLADETKAIAAGTSLPFALTAFDIEDWQRDLMPWDNPVNGAAATLRFLLDDLLPFLANRFGNLPVVLGGYSLAGLFSLWAARETNGFMGVAAASPSVWIQGWPDYTAAHPMQASQVYLSLGQREEHTRNRSFAQVGDRIRSEFALLQQQIGDSACVLEWNPGGHFADCNHRLAKAFIWNLNRLK